MTQVSQIMIRLTLLLACMVVGALSECPPPELLGPCTCILDGEGAEAISCSNIETAEDLVQVFNGLDNEALGSVDVLNSPSLMHLAENMFGDIAIGAIRFYNTGIDEFPNLVFGPTTAESITSLYLKHNKNLMSVDKDLISSLTNLESLYISFNSITSLLGNTTHSSAHYIDLGHNQISEISEGFFQNDKANVVLLGFNDLTSESLHHGSLSFIEDGDDLYLDLGWNSLSDGVLLDTFSGMLPRELLLSGNKIMSLKEDTIGALVQAMMDRYGDEAYILLDNNPLSCECDMQWVVSHSARGLLTDGECADGRLLEHLTDADFSHC